MFFYAVFTISDLHALSAYDIRWLVNTCSAQHISSAYLIAKYANTVPGLISAAAAVVECYEGRDRAAYVACCNEYRGWFYSMRHIVKLLKLYEAKASADKHMHLLIDAEIVMVKHAIQHKDLMQRVLHERGIV
jgi:hypothetical protein